jgi:hypothetical protein
LGGKEARIRRRTIQYLMGAQQRRELGVYRGAEVVQQLEILAGGFRNAEICSTLGAAHLGKQGEWLLRIEGKGVKNRGKE